MAEIDVNILISMMLQQSNQVENLLRRSIIELQIELIEANKKIELLTRSGSPAEG